MIIDQPALQQVPQLRQLWKEAFGDEDAFLDGFYRTGFAPERCRCAVQDGQICAALYWFDAEYAQQKIAYLYAVATAKTHRGQGLCRKLIEDTHNHLVSLGYCLAVLVPCSPELFSFYEKLGYKVLTHVDIHVCQTGLVPTKLRCISAEEFASRRKVLLPANAILQEGATLDFLQTFCSFYEGEAFLMAAYSENGRLFAPEFLGDPALAPAVLTAMGLPEGRFRTPGSSQPFAMYHPLTKDIRPLPEYFGLALD